MSPARLRAYPLAGHAPAFLRDRLGFLDAAAEGAERAVELSIGRLTFLLVDAAEVRHVLVERAEAYEKTPRLVGARGRRVVGDSVLTATGEAHRARRRALQPEFTPKAVEGRVAAIVEAARERSAGWRPGEQIDVAAEMGSIARRAIVRTLFGSLGREDEARLDDAIVSRRRHIEHVFRSLLPAPDRLPGRVNRTYRRHAPVFAEVVSRRLRELDGGAPQDCLLAGLARASVRDGRRDDGAVLDEAMTLLVTGHETVAEALAWTWHLLAAHPEADGRVREEMARVLGDRDPGEGDAISLEYTTRVLAEAMRLFPPTWIFLRVALEDDVLPTGVRIPRGSKIYLSPWVLHRSPRYFPDPGRFDPARFEPDTARGRPRHAYFPFGSGPRICIGEALARTELAAAVAVLVRRHRFVASSDRPVVPEPGITLTPRGGLPMRVEPAVARASGFARRRGGSHLP